MFSFLWFPIVLSHILYIIPENKIMQYQAGESFVKYIWILATNSHNKQIHMNENLDTGKWLFCLNVLHAKYYRKVTARERETLKLQLIITSIRPYSPYHAPQGNFERGICPLHHFAQCRHSWRELLYYRIILFLTSANNLYIHLLPISRELNHAHVHMINTQPW